MNSTRPWSHLPHSSENYREGKKLQTLTPEDPTSSRIGGRIERHMLLAEHELTRHFVAKPSSESFKVLVAEYSVQCPRPLKC